jgi:hypothetical protein
MVYTVQQSALDWCGEKWLKLSRLPTDAQKQTFHLWCYLKTRNEVIHITGKKTIQIRCMLHVVWCHHIVAYALVKVR